MIVSGEPCLISITKMDPYYTSAVDLDGQYVYKQSPYSIYVYKVAYLALCLPPSAKISHAGYHNHTMGRVFRAASL